MPEQTKRFFQACLRLSAVVAFLTLCGAAPAATQTKLLRFPDIHQDKVVFTYAGDLWSVPSAGGTATRLTAHPGLEIFAKLSPDGKWIAFTGQYDGDEQVYVIPVTGGVPRQLTWYPARGPFTPRWGYDNQVHGWTPDGKAVLFRSLRDGWDLSDSRLYTVPLTGSLGEPLPMPMSGAGDLSPDGRHAVYTPLARDFRTWKRYQGGWAQDVWTFDLKTHEAKNITAHPRTDRDPMWIGDKIYFASDRTGTLNLYVYDPAGGPGGQPRQLTDSKKWDVRWPSAGAASTDNADGQIVYESGGELAVYDTRTGRSRAISILAPDDGLYRRPSRVSAADMVESATLSPRGERVLFVARGDVFNAPIEKGVTRNLTRSSGAHDKWARWSPDGRKVAFISDRSGEEEVYLIDPSGTGKPEALTSGGKAMRYAPEWAPDGKRLAFSDKDGKVYVLEIAGRKLAEIADDRRGQVRDYAWSPCGGHLAFSLGDENGFRSLYVWSAADGKLRRVTGEDFDERNPAWDPAGRYLYYLSAREYAPQVEPLDFSYVRDRNDGIYALALRKDVPHPFPPEDDKVTPGLPGAEDEKEKDDAGSKDGKDGGKKPDKAYTRIDFDGLAGRVARVPVPFDNYGNLRAARGRLLYLRGSAFFYGRTPERPTALHVFSFKTRKETPLADEVTDYTLSLDGSKALVLDGDQDFAVYDATPDGKASKKEVGTSGLAVDRVPVEEWTAIFDEVWRRYRDFFYVENMHGYDWAALREQYRPLLAHVAHRSDLNYVIGEMIAELSVSHAYVAGGDDEPPARPKVALPGARFELDEAAGRYRISRILSGQNEEDAFRAPLTEIGVDARAGDYLLAVDGEELLAADNPYRLLRFKSDRPVRLTLNAKPTLEGAREVVFRPIASEADLLYLDWVETNRARVSRLTGGRVGYLHIPDMGGGGLREFIKRYYPQVRKEGLVVDVRGNGGGNISWMLLERLRRVLLSVDFARTSEDPIVFPSATFHGHQIALINETTSSDGDVFAAMFRDSGLGPLVGKRTWGGVVGIGDTGPLIDGGSISVPESASASAQGEWIIEGYGVDPDVEVENDPKSLIEGKDPQLERAVAMLLEKMEKEPRKLPATRPAPPVKTQ